MPFQFQLLVLSIVFYGCLASPNPDVIGACKEIESVAPVVYSGTAYRKELKNYWSYACAETQPYCVVQPTTSQHVSDTLKTLNKYPAAQFAVKSGGHDPNVGHSSIHEGILVALGNMRGATYDRMQDVAYVKPGGQWATVIGDLAPSGVAVVGGRLSVVGVGGLLLSGGLSFLSAQHGLAADNILEMETVFPNGTISNVNEKNNPTLFRAMKGSNTQFGIVTKFTLKTYQMGNVYGGQKMYGPGAEEKLIEAFHDFTENPVDPKAAVILTLERIGNTILPIVFYFYQAPTPPKGVFKKFENVKQLYDNTKTQTYLDLLTSNAFGGASLSPVQRTSFRSATFPNVPGDSGQLQKDVVKNWKETHNKYRVNASSPIVVTSLALQSFQTFIGEQSEKKGGNAMGLSSTDAPRFVAEFTTIWTNGRDDDLVTRMHTQAVDTAEATSKSVVAKGATVNGKKLETYLPYFMNDAGKGQKVTESFKEYEVFKALQREIDPSGLFKRAGGFKY